MASLCPECNEKMSVTAKACPHCGYNPNKQKIFWSKLVGGTALIIGLFTMFYSAGWSIIWVLGGLGLFVYGRLLE